MGGGDIAVEPLGTEPNSKKHLSVSERIATGAKPKGKGRSQKNVTNRQKEVPNVAIFLRLSVPLLRDGRDYLVRRPKSAIGSEASFFLAIAPLLGPVRSVFGPRWAFLSGTKWGCSSDSLRFHLIETQWDRGIATPVSRQGVYFGRVTKFCNCGVLAR